MKILDFFRKKNTEESSNREMDTDPLSSRIRCNQDKIDEMLQNPGFEIYKPFLRVHRDTFAKRWAERFELTHQLPIYNWQYEMTKSAYARDIVMDLIHNINLYIRVRKEESINFGILEMFLLATLACELKIPRVPIIIDETSIINVMESRDMKILYTHFMESRKQLIGTDIEVIIDLVYRYDNDRVPDARFYRKTNIDEIRDLVNSPNFPDGYTEFALYNDHLLYNTWKDFRNQVNPEMTLAEYVKIVFDIVVVTHIYRMDTKHDDFRIKNGVIRDAYYSTLLNACLKEHVCWFPSEEQTKRIIERREETIQHMSELIKSEVEKPFGEELPESVRKATIKPKKKERQLPPEHQEKFDNLLVAMFDDKDHPFVKSYHDELVTMYCLGRVDINGSTVNEVTEGTIKCLWKSYVTEKLRNYHDGYLTPSNICHVVCKRGTDLQKAVLFNIDAWNIILNISLILLVESETITTDRNLDDPDVQIEHVLAGVRAYICGEYVDHGITTVEDYKTYKATGKYPSKEKEELPDDWTPVEKSWDEFRNTGLVQITNQFLHIFGWALTYEKDGDNLRVFPARVRYRGFDEGSQTRAYEKLQKYMIENAEILYKESDYEDEEN